MKLELKHLAPYLPYKLHLNTKYGFITMETLNDYVINGDHEDSYSYDEVKPRLRPLSDLAKEIEVNVERFVPNRKVQWLFDDTCKFQEFIKEGRLSYSKMQKLFEWHFDVFSLIESGLAIDINTLNKTK